MKNIALTIAILTLSIAGQASPSSAQGRDPEFTREAAALAMRAPVLLQTLRTPRRLAAACSITTAHFTKADYYEGEFEQHDPRAAIIWQNKNCCTTMVAGLGAKIGGGLLGRFTIVGKAKPGSPAAIAKTVKTVNKIGKGLLEPIQRDIEAVADQVEANLVAICLPTVAFADILSREDR